MNGMTEEEMHALIDKILHPLPGDSEWRKIAEEYLEGKDAISLEEVRQMNEPVKEAIIKILGERML